MDDVRELVSYLSKAERGYTKTLNREFLKAGFDLSREHMNYYRCSGRKIT